MVKGEIPDDAHRESERKRKEILQGGLFRREWGRMVLLVKEKWKSSLVFF